MEAKKLNLFDENALLNGENLEEQRQLFYKNIEKLKIEEEDLKKPIGKGLTIEKWFEFLFDLQDGYSAMFYLNINREVGQRMYQTYEAKKHVVISEFIHCYVSMNTFFFPKRTKKALRKFGFFYVDVDPRAVKISKEKALLEIYRKIKNNVIPKPSAIVDSGGGYYVIYKLDPVFAGNEKTLKLFGYIENFLVDMLADIGGDHNAKDACRVLRVPGTINSKYSSDTFVKVIEFNDGLIYSFSDFVNLMNKANGFDLDMWRKLKEKKANEGLTSKETEKQTEMVETWRRAVKKKFSVGSLLAARSTDYKKLIMLRGRKMNGFRNTTLWLYGLAQKNLCLTKADLELKLREMNQMFSDPLSIKEVQDTVNSCWEKHYKLYNSNIIKKLHIQPAEQKHLITLIGKAEKYDRNNKRRTPRNEDGLTKRQADKKYILERVSQLKERGYKQREIAEMLDITVDYVKKIYRQLREK